MLYLIYSSVAATSKIAPVSVKEVALPSTMEADRSPTARALYLSENHLFAIQAWTFKKKGSIID